MVGSHRALKLEDLLDQRLGDGAGPLIAEDGQAVDLGDVHCASDRVGADVARIRIDAVAALERGDREVKAAASEIEQEAHDPHIDLTAADISDSALVDRDARLRHERTSGLLLRHQEDLPWLRGAVREGVLAHRPVKVSGLESFQP